MAKLKIKSAGSKVNVWIKFCLGEKADLQEYAVIVSKGIFGLLKPESIQGSKLCYESFSGKQLKYILSSEPSRNQVAQIIEQILLVVSEIEGIGLPRTSLLMDLNSIFVDTGNNEVRMICSSAVSKGKNQTVSSLINEILNAYSTKETSNINFRRRFLDYLASLNDDDIYRIESFLVKEKKRIVLDVRDVYYTRLYKKLSEDQMLLARVDSIKKDIYFEKSKIVSDEDEPTVYMDDDDSTGFITDTNDVTTGFMYDADDEPTGYFGNSDDEPTGYFGDSDDETTGYYESDEDDGEESTGFYEDDDDLTTAFTDPNARIRQEDHRYAKSAAAGRSHMKQSKGPRLIRNANNEVIYINKSNFRLGREAGSVDYCINSNKISRAHADLVLRGKRWYIVDLRSTNRTFVNDRVLAANVETPLQDGDVIRLNNEEFVFYL